MVKSCPKTISLLYDPKSQFMTPNLGSWFVLHHAGVSVEPSCLLCGKGLNPSQGLQPLVTGSSLAATSAPSNHKHQVPWPHLLKSQEELGRAHRSLCRREQRPSAGSCSQGPWHDSGQVGVWMSTSRPRRAARRGGMPGEARRSGSTVAQDGLLLELWSVVFENPFFSSGCGAVRCLGGIARGPSG